MLLDVNENDSIESKSGIGWAILKKERVDERLIENIDISFALTIDVQMILSRQKWMIGNSKVCLVFCWLTMLRSKVRQSNDEVYGCIKGGSGNSRGRRLAISMVEEAWLSEKEEV
ncbi:hypothetical protein Tco_0458061 [Tanacetum coccineum]